MSVQPVSYLQTDPRWANVSYSAGGESTTIGRAGCGPTSMAMVLATWADKGVTPKTECAWALKNGYKAPYQGTYYSYFVPAAKRYGLTCTRVNTASIYGNAASAHHATAKAAVDSGDLVIACMGKGLWTSSGHYVVVWKISGNVVYINDPASTRAVRTAGDYSLFKKQVKYYWVIKAPKTVKKEEPEMTETQIRALVGEEIAARVPGIINQVLAALPAEKVYDSLEEVKKHAPWAYDAVERRHTAGILKGDEQGRLRLTKTMMQMMVMQDRDKEMGMD